jgi:hypothetical protein
MFFADASPKIAALDPDQYLTVRIRQPLLRQPLYPPTSSLLRRLALEHGQLTPLPSL